MRFDILHNFISPVTGRVLADFNYVLVGNKAGIAIPSPILIDLRLDLINLRKRYNNLALADFVIGHSNIQVPNAQVLANLSDGFLYNTEGVVSTLPTSFNLPLCYAASTSALIATYDNGTNGIGATLTGSIGTFTIDGQTPPVNSVILIKDQLLSYQNGIYVLTDTGGIASAYVLTRSNRYDEPGEIQPGDIVAVEFGTVNSSTLWVQTETVNVIGTDAILFISINLFNYLPENDIWIGNPSNRPVPQQRVGLINLPSFRTLNPLNNFGLYNLYTGQGVGFNNPLEVSQPTTTQRIDMSNTPNLTVGKMLIGVKNATPPVITIDGIPPYLHITGSLNWDPLGALDDSHGVANEIGLYAKEIFIGTTDPTKAGQITTTIKIYIDNFPDLTLKRIYRGDLTNRPVESDDLTLLELQVTNIEDVLIPGIEAEIAALEAEIVAIQAEIVEIQGQIIVLGASVAILQAQVLVIQGQIAALNTRIDNLRLNNISADADISVYGFKIINLADPVNPTDAVNLRTLALYPGTVTSVSGTAGQIDVANGTTTPVISIDPAYVGQTSITTLGTITTGVWHGSVIPLANGGTNANLTASNGGIFYSTASAGAILSGTATANQILLSGSSAAPSWSTVTHPATTTINQLLYSSSNNVIAGLATANNGTLITSGAGVPSISSTLPSAVQLNITSLGTVTTGTWNGSVIPLANGGTNANLTASNGGIFYSTGTTGAILSGIAATNRVLLSGSLSAPSWSSATYPTSTTINRLLYSSATNTISEIATANDSVLLTNGSGVPSWQNLAANVVTVISGTSNQIQASSASGVVTLSLSPIVIITTSVQAGNMKLVSNTLQSTDTNGSISIAPNGSGNILMLPSGSTGFVGINQATPNSPLHFSNSVSNRIITLSEVSNNAYQYFGFGTATNILAYNVAALTNFHVFYAGTSSSANKELMRISAGGNGNTGIVGINQSSPVAGLHVVGGVQNIGGEDSVIRAESSSNGAKIELKNTGASGRLFELRSNSNGTFDIVDRTGSAERLIIDSSGNFGISSTPSYLLDVFGTFRTQKLIGNGHAPTVVLGAAAGSSPSSTITGTELNGTFQVTTGSGATTGLIGTFTIAAMPSGTYGVMFMPADSTTSNAGLKIWAASTATTTFTLNTNTALSASTTYKWNYMIMG